MGPVVGGVGQEGGPAGGPAHGPGLCGEAAPLQTDPLAPGLIHLDSRHLKTVFKRERNSENPVKKNILLKKSNRNIPL